MQVAQVNNQSTNFKGGAVTLKGATEKVYKKARNLRRRGILKNGGKGDSFEYLCFPAKRKELEAKVIALLDRASKLQARTTLGANVNMAYVETILSGKRLSMPEVLHVAGK